MLSEKSRPVIEATAAVVAEHMPEITPKFYAHMFEAHPELLDGVFSRANQRNGEQAQALAGSIVKFAVHLLENPGTLPEAVLARIAHKHTALGITEDQYQIVYENLFWAIADVLGDAVTPEVAEAWTEVYWLMADALIKLEKGLYAKQANDKMWLDWKVVSKEPTGNAAVTFRFEPADDTPQTPGEAGGFVSVRVKVADGLRQARQYSLSDHAASTTERVITVKLDEAGEVSPVLIQNVEVGDVIELSNPYGEITPKDDSAPLMLATAGIGITPAASILSSLAEQGSDREVVVLHADASLESVALLGQLTESLSALPNAQAHLWLGVAPEQAPEGITVHEGRMDPSEIELPSGAEVILCGPLAFMQSTRSTLIDAGVPATSIRYEIFGPDIWLAA
ncbi:hemin transporter [Micrococcus luteus]|jgi:nitric oxide dioxygenase|uniref:nitric oxide dioxygenase n=2 Tax=Micrococcus TaxID=1269 RepID=C5C8V0_MICLC|nr:MULTISPECIES: globin domain-containing protein [Micrococcus]ACS29902.1 hemoglobin-like flavoprotein [Micrococcus luteus NCTC 2665]AJO55034.1 hemin transporter [Micrococcus luteus]KAB1902253.1 hemin transporter [Micrococcus luteus NCTC 2665]MBA9081868.1 nitric oxide dioxygenase [Micrococcus aloeverae]ORE62451.1 hemin transporter [Micrococcus luteus]